MMSLPENLHDELVSFCQETFSQLEAVNSDQMHFNEIPNTEQIQKEKKLLDKLDEVENENQNLQLQITDLNEDKKILEKRNHALNQELICKCEEINNLSSLKTQMLNQVI